MLTIKERRKMIMGDTIMSIIVYINWDDEAKVYIALCDEIGLALEADSYDELINRAKDAIPELLELNHIQGCSNICFLTAERRVDCA